MKLEFYIKEWEETEEEGGDGENRQWESGDG